MILATNSYINQIPVYCHNHNANQSTLILQTLIHSPECQVEVDLKHQRQSNANLEADNKRLGSRLEDASQQINALYKENRKIQKDLTCILEGQSTMLTKSTASAAIMYQTATNSRSRF